MTRNKTFRWALLVVALLGILPGRAQRPAPENLVFEGAGIRGIAYAGVIGELEARHLLPGIKRVGGTSAGAVTALLVALGYGGQEIADIISRTDFSKFNRGRYFFAGGIYRTRRYFGWYSGKKADQWLSQLIRQKAGTADLTFLQLRQRGYKDLYVTGTSLTQQRLIVFSHEQFPQMKVKDAVRISMSIPLYFEPVFMDSSGRIVTHPKKMQGLDILVDGGFIGNYPLKIFDSTRYTGDGPNGFTLNRRTLGFRIDSDAQIALDTAAQGLAPMPITHLKAYVNAFYNMIIENLNRQTLTPADWERTVSVSDGRIGPRIRRLSRAEVNQLVHNGRSACARYFGSGR